MLSFIRYIHRHFSPNFLQILQIMYILLFSAGSKRCNFVALYKYLGLSLYFFFVLQVSVERGMSWEDATHVWAEQDGPDDGFYVQVSILNLSKLFAF